MNEIFLNLAKSDDELAFVLAHEIGHVLVQYGRGTVGSLGSRGSIDRTLEFLAWILVPHCILRNRWMFLFGKLAAYMSVRPTTSD